MSFDIDHVAKLARLSLTPEEKEKIGKDLNSILSYIEKLNEVNTDQVEPLSHVMHSENVSRPDEVRQSPIRDYVLDHAPERDGKFFKVPKVVDKE